ncbi:MAG: efflux RND transporter permease subunit, partial [Siphonobacter aquaeclarae]|nr:efflux RND transporter permease subunit [Siphonobacter aquaeclarae]
HQHESNGHAKRPNAFRRIYLSFNRGFERFQSRYAGVLEWNLAHRKTVFAVFLVVIIGTAFMVPYVGRDFFPTVDAGQFRLHMRAPAGTRLEATERIATKVDKIIRETIPANEISTVIANIGLTSESYNFVFQDNSSIGSADAELLVALSEEKSKPTGEYVRKLRARLAEELPDVTIFFQPADIVSQILNFGLTSPIDIQVTGFDRKNNARIAQEIRDKVSKIPGAVDVHLHQVMSAPELFVNIDRERANQLGLNEGKVATNMMISMSGTTQVSPNFWPDPVTGFPYLVAVQTPPYKLNTLDKLMQTPLVTNTGELTPQSLANVARIERRTAPMVVNRLNTQPMYDVYASVERTDLGSVSTAITSIIKEYQSQLKPGNKIEVRGQVESMNSAFSRLGLGLIFAAVLVYMLMVVNFQSFRYPFIIITALPGAMCGVVWLLFLTQTTFSIPSLMGAIMSVGVATANSILLVSFAQEQVFHHHMSPMAAALDAGRTRLRPILMTALAMIIGMLPMSLGLGEGGEQNAPLGRAVIGGLVLATFTTLLFVPIVFSYLAKNRTEQEIAEEKELAEMEI